MQKELNIEEEASRLEARFALLKSMHRMGQAEFARKYEVPGGASMVSQHIKGRRPINLEAAIAYAKGFNCQVADISPRLANEINKAVNVGIEDNETDTNVTEGPSNAGQIPLISWVKAGELCESPDNYQTGDAIDWLECPVKHGPRSYCLQLDGDSMDDGSSDAYRDGEIIFIDPDARAEPGRDVVVRTLENKTTFKRLKQDSEGLYLLGLNGKKIIRVPDGTVFCGVVIFSGKKR
jgi:SOS-response transcriptional repressor LexA